MLKCAIAIVGCLVISSAPSLSATPVPVSPDNFTRAETDRYFGGLVKAHGVGMLNHNRAPAPLDDPVVRLNRDTLYTSAVLDLDAGPATITLPDSGKRFMSMQLINEDQHTIAVYHGPGTHKLTKENIGTRYVVIGIRTLVDPNDPNDMDKVHKLQDAIKLSQPGGPGKFEIPEYDPVSQKKVRDALIALADTLPDTKRMFGNKAQVDPVRFLIGSASAWGGNPETEALYLNIVPAKNDGKTIYRLTANQVPVDGFWSVSLYNAKGYYEKNAYNAYSLNNTTAKKNTDGSITIQFGGCDGKVLNCLPTMPGWNYMVRLYQPRAEILDGKWTFPTAQPVM
jgi:hypothetical protein